MTDQQFVDMTVAHKECELWTLYNVQALTKETARRVVENFAENSPYTYEFAIGVNGEVACEVFATYYEEEYEFVEHLTAHFSASMTSILMSL